MRSHLSTATTTCAQRWRAIRSREDGAVPSGTAGAWDTGNMTSREDVHRLVDAAPETELPGIEQALRRRLAEPGPDAARRFSCVGTLSAEHDLAERSEDILRQTEGSTAT